MEDGLGRQLASGRDHHVARLHRPQLLQLALHPGAATGRDGRAVPGSEQEVVGGVEDERVDIKQGDVVAGEPNGYPLDPGHV